MAAEEEFNETEWEENWLDANPPIEIPDEVILDVDDDLEPEENWKLYGISHRFYFVWFKLQNY